MLPRLLFATLLIGHAAIHATFLAPPPPATATGPRWPFDPERSWILAPLGVRPDVMRLLATALVTVTMVGFALAAISSLGVLSPDIWAPATVVGAVASFGLLGLFFNPWLVLGLVIDLGLLWVVFVEGWLPQDAPLA